MILEEMYSGRFYPCETVVPTSEVYRKAVKACEKLMEQLSQRLSKDGFSAGLIVQHEAYEQVNGEK